MSDHTQTILVDRETCELAAEALADRAKPPFGEDRFWQAHLQLKGSLLSQPEHQGDGEPSSEPLVSVRHLATITALDLLITKARSQSRTAGCHRLNESDFRRLEEIVANAKREAAEHGEREESR